LGVKGVFDTVIGVRLSRSYRRLDVATPVAA